MTSMRKKYTVVVVITTILCWPVSAWPVNALEWVISGTAIVPRIVSNSFYAHLKLSFLAVRESGVLLSSHLEGAL